MPKNGKILTKNHAGKTVEVKVGDIVSTDAMKEFKYDQGENRCSNANKDLCDDSFEYTTMSSWIGTGVESEAEINLTPVTMMRDENALEELSTSTEEFEMTPNMDKQEAL